MADRVEISLRHSYIAEMIGFFTKNYSGIFYIFIDCWMTSYIRMSDGKYCYKRRFWRQNG